MWKTPNVAEETTWWLLGQIMVGQWKTFCISWLHMNVGSSFTDGNQDKETLCCASLVLAKSGRIPVTRVSLLISIYKDKRCSFRQQNRTAEIMWPNIRSHDFHTSSGERTWSQNMHVSGPFLHEKNVFQFLSQCINWRGRCWHGQQHIMCYLLCTCYCKSQNSAYCF